MQTLGLSSQPQPAYNLFKRLFWPTIESQYDVDLLCQQGFYVCFTVATISLLLLSFMGTPSTGLFTAVVYFLADCGVRESSVGATALVEARLRSPARIPGRRQRLCRPAADVIARYEIFDPVARSQVRLEEAEATSLNPFAFYFYRPFPNQVMKSMDLLRFGLRGCGHELSTIVWMGTAAVILSMITPLVTGVVFDRLIPGAERGQLMQICSVLAVVAVVTAMFNLVRSFGILRLEGKLDSALQSAYWDRLLKLPVPFFRNYTSGDLAARSLAIAQIRQALTGSTVTAVLSGIFSVFSFALLFYYSWRLACVATLLVAFAFAVSLLCGYAQMGPQRGVLHLRGVLSGRVLQMVDGFAKFRVSGTEQRAFAFWAKEFSKQKLLWAKIRNLTNVFVVFNAVFPVVSLGAIFFFHAYLLEHPAPNATPITTGDFLAFIAAYTQFLTAALLQSAAIISILNIVPTYDRARPILETLPEVTEAKSAPGKLTGAIEISHINFRYRADTPPVLRDVSLSIQPGEYVAFVGSSGSGKSTLLRLLLGFEKTGKRGPLLRRPRHGRPRSTGHPQTNWGRSANQPPRRGRHLYEYRGFFAAYVAGRDGSGEAGGP